MAIEKIFKEYYQFWQFPLDKILNDPQTLDVLRLRLTYISEIEKNIFLSVLSNFKTPDASHNSLLIAYQYFFGIGVPQDYGRTADLLKKIIASNNNHASSLNLLAYLYEFGCGVPEKYSEAHSLYTKAAEQGYPSETNLGFLYYHGKGVSKDPQKAYNYYLQASKKNNTAAFINLAYFHLSENSTQKDNQTALSYYLEAAKRGNPNALAYSGVFYQEGRVVEQNFQTAHDCYLLAAAKGSTAALNNLAILYANGSGVSKDEVFANKLKDSTENKEQKLSIIFQRKSNYTIADYYAAILLEDITILAKTLENESNISIFAQEFLQNHQNSEKIIFFTCTIPNILLKKNEISQKLFDTLSAILAYAYFTTEQIDQAFPLILDISNPKNIPKELCFDIAFYLYSHTPNVCEDEKTEKHLSNLVLDYLYQCEDSHDQAKYLANEISRNHHKETASRIFTEETVQTFFNSKQYTRENFQNYNLYKIAHKLSKPVSESGQEFELTEIKPTSSALANG